MYALRWQECVTETVWRCSVFRVKSCRLTTTFQSGQLVLVGQTRGGWYSPFISVEVYCPPAPPPPLNILPLGRDVRTNDITSLRYVRLRTYADDRVFIFVESPPSPTPNTIISPHSPMTNTHVPRNPPPKIYLVLMNDDIYHTNILRFSEKKSKSFKNASTRS